MCGFISGPSTLFHWSIWLFLCQYPAVSITTALDIFWRAAMLTTIPLILEYILKSENVRFLAWFFLCRIALALQGLSWFHMNFRIFFSISVKNAIKVLIKITLSLQTTLDSLGILTILILPIHEHRMSFHLYVLSLNSSSMF